MKAHYYLFILLQLIYLTKCDELWKVNKLTDTNLRQLEKIAKVTQNTKNISPNREVNPVRFSRSFEKSQARRSRIGEIWNEVTRNEVEAANNTVSDLNEKINNNNNSSSSSSSSGGGKIHLADTNSTASVSHSAKRESAGKRKQATKVSMSPKPGITEGTPKPTKYHYYPHNQHIYLLPECAIQQVCNAVYVRLNYTQPLCACPSRKEPCSASLNTDDMHTTELVTASTGKVLTLVKTCEPVAEMRICRAPRDWSLLALQNVRTGKSHYLVICRCPQKGRLEGPMSHDQPAYASVPGIRVYGMMCVRDSYRLSRPFRIKRSLRSDKPEFPWNKLKKFQASIKW